MQSFIPVQSSVEQRRAHLASKSGRRGGVVVAIIWLVNQVISALHGRNEPRYACVCVRVSTNRVRIKYISSRTKADKVI